MFYNNRSILDNELSRLNEWDNADGFDMDSAFGDDAYGDDSFGDNSFSEAAAAQHRHAAPPVRAKLHVSMPYIFTVVSSDPATQAVVLFGSEKNRTATNFGNTANISITYDFSGYYGGGTSGYGALLARTESAPIVFGRIRMESTNQLQLSAPLNVSDYDPT
jgi:hypothetical protein